MSPRLTLSLRAPLPRERLAALGLKPPPPPPDPRKAIFVMVATLQRRWPDSFGALRPLKVGIDRDVRAALPELSRTAISRAMNRYTRNPAYLAALAAPGAVRVDLDGAVVEAVADEDREHAVERLRQRDEWLAARRAARQGAGAAQ
jgi:sRNA-binding protein